MSDTAADDDAPRDADAAAEDASGDADADAGDADVDSAADADAADSAADADAGDSAADDGPASDAAAPAAARPAILHRWMGWALVVALLGGAPAGLWYYQYTSTWQKRPPKVDLCFEGLKPRLKEPVVVSASEPYLDRSTGETIYLTETQYRAVQCTEILPEGVSSRLARAYAEEDPDKEAAALSEAARAAPSDSSGDKEALGMWMLVSSSLEALPKSKARDLASSQADQFIGCRFDHPRLPQCASKPPFPFGIYLLGGVGGFALALVLASILQTAATRFSSRSKKPQPQKARS